MSPLGPVVDVEALDVVELETPHVRRQQPFRSHRPVGLPPEAVDLVSPRGAVDHDEQVEEVNAQGGHQWSIQLHFRPPQAAATFFAPGSGINMGEKS